MQEYRTAQGGKISPLPNWGLNTNAHCCKDDIHYLFPCTARVKSIDADEITDYPASDLF
jgi:hypothetical protein